MQIRLHQSVQNGITKHGGEFWRNWIYWIRQPRKVDKSVNNGDYREALDVLGQVCPPREEWACRVVQQLDHFRSMFLFELFSRCIPLLPTRHAGANGVTLKTGATEAIE